MPPQYGDILFPPTPHVDRWLPPWLSPVDDYPLRIDDYPNQPTFIDNWLPPWRIDDYPHDIIINRSNI